MEYHNRCFYFMGDMVFGEEKMKLTIDLESRSEIDLREVGVYPYAYHDSTDILCFAFKEDDLPTKIWVMPRLRKELIGLESVESAEFFDAINRAKIIEAHNMNFERVMWRIMELKYSAPRLPLEKLSCSAAKAAYFALPRDLKGACLAINSPVQKSDSGHKLMLKMCKPRRPTKKDGSLWHEKPEDITELCKYCIQDVESEYALSESLPPFPKHELALWRVDQIINDRGIKVDLKAIRILIDRIKEKESDLLEEILHITKGVISSPRQVAASIEWLNCQGVLLPNLQKATVENALKNSLPKPANRFLEIRQHLGMSSVSKLSKMQDMAICGRVRGTMLYHGASTGRWAGRGIQPHNYPRDSFSSKDINKIIALQPELSEILYGNALQVGSKCLRGMLIAGKGKKLVCADYASIEARVLAWLTGESKVLEAFESGLDMYKVNAQDIYHVKYDSVTKAQRQIGKVCELALGYQGWLGAFHSMAKNYGVEISDDEAKKIILAWRDSRPKTVKYWEMVELAAIKAIRDRKPTTYGCISFGVRKNFLHCRLPSGRLLSYPFPELKIMKTPYGVEKVGIRFMGVNSVTRKWNRESTYGGKLTENIVQAIARDLLAVAIMNLNFKGYKIVMHVHDEILAEEKNPDLKEFIKIMTSLPDWADGLPLAADGWVGKRYRK